VRKLGDPTPVTADDYIHLGSNTKAMTATLIAILIEEGKLTWNTTLGQALGNYTGNINPQFRNATIYQLATHASGFTEDTTLGDRSFWISLWNMTALPGREQYVQRALASTPANPLGTFEYSNINYVTLGFLIDRLVGPWEDVIKERLWKPLNMTACGFGPVPESSDTSVDNPWAHALNPTNQQIVPVPRSPATDNPPAIAPAGTVHCRPSSYTKFLALHLGGLTQKSTALLKPETFAVLLQGGDDDYVPGGWVKQKQDPRVAGNWWIHSGSNTYNYLTAILAPGRDEAYLSYTNIGTTQAANGTNAVHIEFFDRKLNLNGTNVINASTPINSPTNTTSTPKPNNAVSLLPRSASTATALCMVLLAAVISPSLF